jgi:type II secretory pathway component PulJ
MIITRKEIKMKRNQLLPYLSMIAVLMLVSACSGSTTTTSNEAAPVIVIPSDPTEALASSLKAQLALPAYRGNLESQYQGKTNSIIVEYMSPDRYRVKNDSMEAILIGKETYINLSGKWSKMGTDLSSVISSFRDQKLIETGLSNVKYFGSEQVNGISASVYTYTNSVDLNGQKMTADAKVWVSQANNLPVKMEVTGEVSGEKTLSTITYDYASKVSIEAPM